MQCYHIAAIDTSAHKQPSPLKTLAIENIIDVCHPLRIMTSSAPHPKSSPTVAIHFTATLRSQFTNQASTIFLFKDPFFSGSFPNIYNPVDKNGVIRSQVEARILDFLAAAYGAHVDGSMHELVVTGNMDVVGRVTVQWIETVSHHVSTQNACGYY